MAFLRTRPAFRRFALSLAAAQLLAYAAAPVVEALTEEMPGPVSVEAAHSTTCVPVHQATTCIACQLLTFSARRAESVPVHCTREERAAPVDLTASISPRAPPAPHHSRAPPLPLG